MRKQQLAVAHKSFFLSHRSYVPAELSEPPDRSRKPLEKESCNTGSSTGRSSGPHLHFALAVGSAANMAPGYEGWVQISTLAPIDPRVYLPDYVDNI